MAREKPSLSSTSVRTSWKYALRSVLARLSSNLVRGGTLQRIVDAARGGGAFADQSRQYIDFTALRLVFRSNFKGRPAMVIHADFHIRTPLARSAKTWHPSRPGMQAAVGGSITKKRCGFGA